MCGTDANQISPKQGATYFIESHFIELQVLSLHQWYIRSPTSWGSGGFSENFVKSESENFGDQCRDRF